MVLFASRVCTVELGKRISVNRLTCSMNLLEFLFQCCLVTGSVLYCSITLTTLLPF